MLTLTLLCVALLVEGDAPAPAPLDAPNYKLLRPGLAVAGQPSAAALATLATSGFKSVVNLRSADEPGAVDERTSVEGAGLRYVQVPVKPETFSSADVDQVASVLDQVGAGPVLLHCGSSNRVGAVLAVLAHRRGSSLADALAEGKAAGLASDSMIKATERVIASEAAGRK